MSFWKSGKLNIKCSVNVLRKALENVMPEWKDLISVSEGESRNSNMFDSELVVRKVLSDRPEDNDVNCFFKKDGDTWIIHYDGDTKKDLGFLEGNLKAEIARMKVKALAKLKGHEILEDHDGEFAGVTKIRIKIEN